jgi:hypothetical protein
MLQAPLQLKLAPAQLLREDDSQANLAKETALGALTTAERNSAAGLIKPQLLLTVLM